MGTLESVLDSQDPTNAKLSFRPQGFEPPESFDPFNGDDGVKTRRERAIDWARARLKKTTHRHPPGSLMDALSEAGVREEDGFLARAKAAREVVRGRHLGEELPGESQPADLHGHKPEVQAARNHLNHILRAPSTPDANNPAGTPATVEAVPETVVPDNRPTRDELHRWLRAAPLDRVFSEETIHGLEGDYDELARRYQQVDELVARHPEQPNSITLSTGLTRVERQTLLDNLVRDLDCNPDYAQRIGTLPPAPDDKGGIHKRIWGKLGPKPLRKDPRKEALSFEVMPTKDSRVALVVTRAGDAKKSEIQGVHVLVMPDPVFRLAADASANLEMTRSAQAYVVNHQTFELSKPLDTAPGAILRVPEIPVAPDVPPPVQPPPDTVPLPRAGVEPATTPSPASAPVPPATHETASYVPGVGTVGRSYLEAARSALDTNRGRQRNRRTDEAANLAREMLGLPTTNMAHNQLLGANGVYRTQFGESVNAEKTIRRRVLDDFFAAHAAEIEQQRQLMQGDTPEPVRARLQLLSELMMSPDYEQTFKSLARQLEQQVRDAAKRLPFEITLPMPDDPDKLSDWAAESILLITLRARAQATPEEAKRLDPFDPGHQAEALEKALKSEAQIWLAEYFVDSIRKSALDVRNHETISVLQKE
jgi:hypothetical protein